MLDFDEARLNRLRAGEEAAWSELHREHFGRLWSSVQRLTQNPSATDDIVQEAFVKAFREIHRFQGQSQLGTWLYRIAINQGLDALRRKQRMDRWLTFLAPVDERNPGAQALPEGSVAAQASSGLERDDLRNLLTDAMAELTPDHRAVVQLRLIDEQSLEETARQLRCKPGTVNSRLHYACEHLRRRLRQSREAAPRQMTPQTKKG